jgi:DNA-nicking Smr family endonuclease
VRKRHPSGEERELFEETVKDAKPLKGRPPRPRKAKAAPAATPPPLAPITDVKPLRPPAKPRAGPTGLDGRTADRLRRGQLEPDARLDLHGLTESSAHRALLTFVKGAQARGHRLLLIVTGKGGKGIAPDAPFDLELDRRARGVLRTMTPRWLKERGLVELVAEVRTAHVRHGGTGALYVYLRKRSP